MTWEYYLVGGAAAFLALCGLVFTAVLALVVFRRSRPKSATAASAFGLAPRANLAGAMETIDVEAKAAAYEAVSDKIKSHRAGRYEAELLDALAPKGDAKS